MSKNFFQNGKWTERRGEPLIVVCSCGNKYIKTRRDQAVCLRCIAGAARERRAS